MLRLDTSDTIAAIGSPPGPAVRGIIRLSGPEAWAFGLGNFSWAGGRRPNPRRATMFRGELRVSGLGPPLPSSILLWPPPRTYTGQEMAEIHSTGSPPIVQQILSDCLNAGARLAEPGEFTLRAFLSGRIDLTQAEAVLGVIDAANPAQLEAALQQLAGGLAAPISQLRDQLLDTLAHLEAGLDFVDEADVDPLASAALAQSLADAAGTVADLADRLASRDRPGGRPRVVFLGPPNAGKSRLFNALVGETRAIVSPEAGTTRDYVSALADCDGLAVELFDTAGVEDGDTAIKSLAQRFRREVVATADLVLACGSGGTGFTGDGPRDRPRLHVWTKVDLGPGPPEVLATSAETGLGIPELRAAIARELGKCAGEIGVASTGARCGESLIKASRALRSASETLILGGGDELVAIDVRLAIDELGKVVGAEVSDDILDRIFRRFCIGK